MPGVDAYCLLLMQKSVVQVLDQISGRRPLFSCDHPVQRMVRCLYNVSPLVLGAHTISCLEVYKLFYLRIPEKVFLFYLKFAMDAILSGRNAFCLYE